MQLRRGVNVTPNATGCTSTCRRRPSSSQSESYVQRKRLCVAELSQTSASSPYDECDQTTQNQEDRRRLAGAKRDIDDDSDCDENENAVNIEIDPNTLSTLTSALCEEDLIGEKSWLTSTLIDLAMLKFAIMYPNVHFLPTEFVPLHLESAARNMLLGPEFLVYDILGRAISYSSRAPVVFVANVSHIHWNLFRVQHRPSLELQLFEPMGRPSSRKGVSQRYVPRTVIEWLDRCFPIGHSWLRNTVSAITKRQQYSGFDCGVACLLYAEKCGRGIVREEINEWTDQVDITSFRKELRLFMETYRPMEKSPPGSPLAPA